MALNGGIFFSPASDTAAQSQWGMLSANEMCCALKSNVWIMYCSAGNRVQSSLLHKQKRV